MAMHGKNCIIKNQSMTEIEKQESLELYEQMELEYGPGINTAEKVFDAIKYKKYLKAKNRTLTAERTMRNILRMEKFAERSSGNRYGHAVLSFVSPDARGVMRSFNLENRSIAYRNDILSGMADFTLATMKKGITGGRGKGFLGFHAKASKADQASFIREASNVAEGVPATTGNPKMRAMAEAYLESFEKARQLYNKFGGNMPKMKGWFIKQTHTAASIRKMTRPDYVKFTMDRLNKDEIISYKTNQPVTDLELRLLVEKHYDDITADDPGTVLQKAPTQSLNASRSRIFKFKDFDSWYEYNNQFGESDIFSNIVEHADKMGRDIAEMQILGPQPQKVFNNMIEYAEKAYAAGKGNKKGIGKAQQFYDVFKRKHNEAANEFVASLGTVGRGLATAFYLTQTILTAIADTATSYVTARKIGISGTKPIRNLISNTLKFTATAGMSTKQRNAFLLRAGVIAEDSIFAARAASKEAGDALSGKGWTQILGDVVMRAQGLTAWTNGLRSSMAQETMGYYAQNIGKSFDQLDPYFQNSLQKYELDTDWDLIRKAKPETYKGATFITKKSLKEIDPELAMRYHEMILDVMNDGVILAGIKSTAAALLGTTAKRGTFVRETLGNVFQFKNFPISVYIQHLYGQAFEDNVNTRMFGMNVNPKLARTYNVIQYAGLATAMGLLSIQLRSIKDGKDPRSMDPRTEEGRKTLRDGFFRGGGAGILEEILRDPLSVGTGITLTGPVGSMLSDTSELTAGNLYEYASTGESDFSDDLYDYIRRYNIIGNLPYTKLATDRLIIDQVAENLDPGLKHRIRKKISRQEKRRNQKYWWKPFDPKPSREIDWEKAVE